MQCSQCILLRQALLQRIWPQQWRVASSCFCKLQETVPPSMVNRELMARNGAAVILRSSIHVSKPQQVISPRNMAPYAFALRLSAGQAVGAGGLLGANPITWSCLFFSFLLLLSSSNSSSCPSYSTDFLQAATQDEYDPRVLVFSALIASFPFLSSSRLVLSNNAYCLPTQCRHHAAIVRSLFISFYVCTYTSSATSPGLLRSPLLEVARIYLR